MNCCREFAIEMGVHLMSSVGELSILLSDARPSRNPLRWMIYECSHSNVRDLSLVDGDSNERVTKHLDLLTTIK
jgi:hypothetical protein